MSTPEERSIAYFSKPRPCGHCRWGHIDPETGIHASCPRATRNGDRAAVKIVTCDCSVPGCGDQVLRCLDCKHEGQDEIDPANWSCIDQYACQARQERNRANNPLVQKFIEIRRTAMARVANENAEKQTKAGKPKTGSCVHCGEETKGGKFLPGHDAAYVSGLVAASLAKPATEDANRKKAVAASEALGKKFDKSIGLAKDKAVKAAQAKADKAAAKDEKAATPAPAKATKATASAKA